jgi:hypothetical protein
MHEERATLPSMAANENTERACDMAVRRVTTDEMANCLQIKYASAY